MCSGVLSAFYDVLQYSTVQLLTAAYTTFAGDFDELYQRSSSWKAVRLFIFTFGADGSDSISSGVAGHEIYDGSQTQRVGSTAAAKTPTFTSFRDMCLYASKKRRASLGEAIPLVKSRP